LSFYLRFAGSNPAEDDGFLREIIIRSTTYLGEEAKLSSPCRKSLKVKQSLYTPWRRLGGEEV
jgi:hypothetical protein